MAPVLGVPACMTAYGAKFCAYRYASVGCGCAEQLSWVISSGLARTTTLFFCGNARRVHIRSALLLLPVVCRHQYGGRLDLVHSRGLRAVPLALTVSIRIELRACIRDSLSHGWVV